MKAIKADLLSDVVGTYDQTKTTIQGRVASKVISGDDVLGPPLNKFIDTFTDTAGNVVPTLSTLSPNGRLFSVTSEVGGIVVVSLHTVNLTTGATAYVGMIRMSIADNAATTHTYRSIKVVDNGTTGWKIYLVTSGTVLINGGVYCANSVDLADFLAIAPGTLFPSATGSNQKATYFLQDPSNIGVGQLNIASAGAAIDLTNNRLYVHNGVSATHQYYVYDTSAVLDCPTTAGLAISDVTDRVTQVAHGYVDNTPIFISSLVGGTGLTNNTVYFVRNSTANDYQVSLTSGGAVINITVAGTASVSRAFGTSGSAFVHKTGNLPALTGTLILLDSEDYAVPGHTANATFPCVFFATTTNLYLGRLSDLTSGAVTWPSLVTSNILGSVNQITGPTVALATWSTVLDHAVYLTNTNVLIMKQVVNNSITKIFAGINNKYRETFSSDTVELGFVTATAIDIQSGWLIMTGSTVGQRGNILCDLRSDKTFDYSYIVTKVLETPDSVYDFVASTEKLESMTGSISVQYRTSGFGSISGGWITLPQSEDISGFTPGQQTQFKVSFDTLNLDTCIHSQVSELFLGLDSNFAISDNWEFSDDFSDNGVPSRTAFRLKQAYVSTVPTLYYRAYDLSGALLLSNDSVTNAINFEYSTDSGMTWLPLGTIPNVVGTMIRYSFTTPPGVDIRPSLKEE
jgi:hypothetical protein